MKIDACSCSRSVIILLASCVFEVTCLTVVYAPIQIILTYKLMHTHTPPVHKTTARGEGLVNARAQPDTVDSKVTETRQSSTSAPQKKQPQKTAYSFPRSRVCLSIDGGTVNVSGAYSQSDRWQSDKPNCHRSPGSPWLMLVAPNQYKPGELSRWNFLFFSPPPPPSLFALLNSDEG